MYDVSYQLYYVVHFFSTFWFVEKSEKMARMKKDSNYFDLIDPVGIVSASSIVHPECSVVGMSHHAGVGWIPLTYIYIYIYIL